MSGIGGSAGEIETQADDLRHMRDTVLGLIAAYLLVVGPIDYLLVHRVLSSPVTVFSNQQMVEEPGMFYPALLTIINW